MVAAGALSSKKLPKGRSSRWLYAIGYDYRGSPLKIGIATDIKDRVAALQIGSPYPLFVHAYGEIIAEKQYSIAKLAPQVEREIHAALAYCRLSGEWFDVELDTLCIATMMALNERDYSVAWHELETPYSPKDAGGARRRWMERQKIQHILYLKKRLAELDPEWCKTEVDKYAKAAKMFDEEVINIFREFDKKIDFAFENFNARVERA